MNRFYVGDKVRTKHGLGEVEGSCTWRERIEEMNEYDAIEFSSLCKRQCGNNFKNDWVEVLVSTKDENGKVIVHTMDGNQVEILNGREEEYDIFSGKITS